MLEDIGVDKNLIPFEVGFWSYCVDIDADDVPFHFKFLQMCGRGGMVLSRPHAEGILSLSDMLNYNITYCWNGTLYPELVRNLRSVGCYSLREAVVCLL